MLHFISGLTCVRAIHVKIGVDNKAAVRTTPKALRDYFHCQWPKLFEYKLSNIAVMVMFNSMSGLTCVGNFIYHIRYLQRGSCTLSCALSFTWLTSLEDFRFYSLAIMAGLKFDCLRITATSTVCQAAIFVLGSYISYFTWTRLP